MSSDGPKGYDAILSYNSHDREAVEALADRLRQRRLGLYLEVWELLPGRKFQPGLAQALTDSRTCVVCLGPNGLGPWQKEEIEVAIDRRVRVADFHVIPVLLPGAERPRRGAVAHLEFLINASWVEFPRTLDDPRAFEGLVAGITGVRPEPPREEVRRWEGRRPYRGLEAFGRDDRDFFFGRENLTDWLVSDLRREVRAPHGVRFLAVLGPSGSGKSSVVLAGLLPRLEDGAIDGSARWPVAVVRPGDDPLRGMVAEVVARFLPPGAVPDVGQALDLIAALERDEAGLDLFARLALHDAPAECRLVVVVDQFEEVFTYEPKEGLAKERFARGRAAFLANLLRAAATPDGRVAVVLTMRSDFLGPCAAFPKLNDVLNAHLVQVGPMREPELRTAIERPAYRVGCEVEPALTERLLADVAGQAGALPLLQFALDQLWEKRPDRVLRLRAYEALGGVKGALENRANEVLGRLSPEDRELCRRIFLRLVQPGEGTEDTKRRVPFHELHPDDPARAEAVQRVIQLLAHRDARLITTDEGAGGERAVEVAREALIQGWTTLHEWIKEARSGLLIHRRLTDNAKEWADAAPDAQDSYLYRDVRLADASNWARSHRDELSAAEAAFLGASQEAERQRKADEVEKARRLAEAERLRAEEAEARKRDAEAAVERQRRLSRKFLITAAVAGALALAAGGLFLWANQARNDALTSARLARLREAETLTNVGVVALEQGHTFEAMHQFARAVASVAGDPDSERTLGIMNRIRLGVLSRESPRLAAIMEHAGPVTSAAFSSDGTRVVTASGDGTARVWDLGPMEGAAAALPRWVEAVTGTVLEAGAVRGLGADEWQERRRALQRDFGAQAPLLDPTPKPGGVRPGAKPSIPTTTR